jgi:hypothetical protein
MRMPTEVPLIHSTVNAFLFGSLSQQLYEYSLSGGFHYRNNDAKDASHCIRLQGLDAHEVGVTLIPFQKYLPSQDFCRRTVRCNFFPEHSVSSCCHLLALPFIRMVGFGSLRGLTCKHRISPVMKTRSLA